jgi:hypothetical protein
MDLDLWPLLDALMTWVIIPIAAMLVLSRSPASG